MKSNVWQIVKIVCYSLNSIERYFIVNRLLYYSLFSYLFNTKSSIYIYNFILNKIINANEENCESFKSFGFIYIYIYIDDMDKQWCYHALF